MSAAVIPAAPLPATTMSNSAALGGLWRHVVSGPILEHVTVFAEADPEAELGRRADWSWRSCGGRQADVGPGDRAAMAAVRLVLAPD